MKIKQTYWTGIIAALCLMFLITDSQSVQEGARQGIDLLLHAVIPALFPFMLLTTYLNHLMLGKMIPGLSQVGALCRIPKGAESAFLLGLLAGYPVGAKTVYDTYVVGQLDHKTAKRLLGFCSNAGPAFIFGIIGPMFTLKSMPFIIWCIHILSAVLVGVLLPGQTQNVCCIPLTQKNSFSQVIEKCIKTMSVISAWIIIWKIITTFLLEHLIFKLPISLRVIVIGLCELTNGCLLLPSIKNEAIRFIVASCLLASGGLCIAMQTASVTKTLGMGMYLPGKLLQVLFSFVLTALFSPLLYPGSVPYFLFSFIPVAVLAIFVVLFFTRRYKKR